MDNLVFCFAVCYLLQLTKFCEHVVFQLPYHFRFVQANRRNAVFDGITMSDMREWIS